MTEAQKLTLLKKDLQQMTTANDEYLTHLLNYAKAVMEREGITVTKGDIECETAVIHYAAYLFRKRAGTETAMPRFLRYELNNLLFSQKGAVE